MIWIINGERLTDGGIVEIVIEVRLALWKMGRACNGRRGN